MHGESVNSFIWCLGLNLEESSCFAADNYLKVCSLECSTSQKAIFANEFSSSQQSNR